MNFDILVEDYLGFYTKDKITYTLDVNASLSELHENCRGMILPNGDLITLRNENSNSNVFIHMDVFNAYNKYQIEKNKTPLTTTIYTNNTNTDFYRIYAEFYKYLFVQRFKNTNLFYLGESYSPLKLQQGLFKNQMLMQEYKTNFESKNITKELVFVKFISPELEQKLAKLGIKIQGKDAFKTPVAVKI